MDERCGVSGPNLIGPKPGDYFWVWTESEPSLLEKHLSNRISRKGEDADHYFLSIFSCAPGLVDGAIEEFIEFKESSAFAFVVKQVEKEALNILTPSLHFGLDGRTRTVISYGGSAPNFWSQFLLVLASPFSEEKENGSPVDRALKELGLLACHLGEGIKTPSIHKGYFSVSKMKFVDRSVQVVSGQGAHSSFSRKISELRAAGFDFSDSDPSLDRALAMVGRALNSREAVAKWIYYRAALEQAFGRNYLNAVRSFYRKDTAAKEFSYLVAKRLKDLRDDVVHQGKIGKQEEFDERALQQMVIDGISRVGEGSAQTGLGSLLRASGC